MRALDERLQRAYFRLEEAQRQRLWMQRVWHPELFNWAKPSGPPAMTETKRIRQEELSRLGFGEAHYDAMMMAEKQAHEYLVSLAAEHPLAPHFDRISGLGMYLCGAFIAAGGDIDRAPTVSAFWKGMGLDLLPDGTVPRRMRGSRDVERRIPCLPHVSRVGEQIRQQIPRSHGRLREWYDHFREQVDAKNPDRAKMFNFKGALRLTQKLLYACLWREWRLAYGLEAPEPYAFAILKHDNGGLITMADFYDPEPTAKVPQ